MKHTILSIDQGTTSTRAIIFNENGNIIKSSQKELNLLFPKDGWVEHNPKEIILQTIQTAKSVISQTKDKVDTIGITNQRETTLIWDKKTGVPVSNAIGWEDIRTSKYCTYLESKDFNSIIKKSTGLNINPYFSATKIRWILDSIPDGQIKAENGDLCFGTVDSWIIYNLTKKKLHVTDLTNASRTMLLNIYNLEWDKEILRIFNIPMEILPKILPSSYNFGFTDPKIFGYEIPITGIAGDQHASMFGHACFEKGTTKCTYGTGAFILTNEGNDPSKLKNTKLLNTIGFQLKQKTFYATEGSIFSTGSAVQWIRDGIGLIKNPSDTNTISEYTKDNGGLYFVPAFNGLGSPHWKTDAEGIISGIKRTTNKYHIIRAALESTAFQVKDVVEASITSSNSRLPIKVDGGQTKNSFLMQFQADILDRQIKVAKVPETTALGVAFLAGLKIGIWNSIDEIKPIVRSENIYEPKMKTSKRDSLYSQWCEAIQKSSLTVK